jgi:hypothetical protein|tara:strand:- start:2166 stop:2459 length:294 start_codon:yes stop_codon:yes gene_type:complete
MISLTAAATTDLIAAPSAGHIEIDHISLLPSGGANTITLDFGADVLTYALDDSQAYTFDNASGDTPIVADEATAVTITLSSATVVTGLVLYRVIGEQ